MDLSLIFHFSIAAFLRLWLCFSEYRSSFQERVEISTPINAWKNLIEGITLLNDNVNPYVGDMFHESPIVLFAFNTLVNSNHYFIEKSIPFLFIGCDLVTATLLYFMARSYITQLLKSQNEQKKHYASNVSRILIDSEEFSHVPKYVAFTFLYNPFTILNCISFTTTVWANLFLALLFFSFVRQKPLLASLALAMTVMHNIYPITLIVPASLHLHHSKKSWRTFVCGFFIVFGLLLYICFALMNYDSSFIEATYGFQLTVPNLQPNIGLFWYFFTEMFEHFRVLFLVAFQINAIILYVVPLSVRLNKEPVLVAICLTGLAAVFKSYPCVGDVALYLSLMPLCKYLFPFMQQGFIVSCFCIGCSFFAPTVWHLWIYSRSANANFYFGVTLAFATSQIFLLTDILFAYLKRDHSLKNGIQKTLNGKAARLVLD